MAAFEIDGREYVIPAVFDLTMGEAQTLYDYSGYTLEDFVPPVPGEEDDRLAKLKNPAFKRAMANIAYRRGNPDMPAADVAAAVEGFDMFPVTAAMYQDDDADPSQVSQSRQPSSSGDVVRLTNGSSGRRSPTSAGQPGATPAPTGLIA